MVLPHMCSPTALTWTGLLTPFSIQVSTEGRALFEAVGACCYWTLHVGQGIFRGCLSVGGSETPFKLQKKKMELGKSCQGTKHYGAHGHEHPWQLQLKWRGSPAVTRCLSHQPKGCSGSHAGGMGSGCLRACSHQLFPVI